MNRTTNTLLFALMLPAVAMLAACNDAADDEYVAPATTDAAPPVDTMPVEPAEPMMPPEEMDAAVDDMAFADMDANQDGGVTMEELSPDQMLHQHFAVADADGDGMLTEAEIEQHRADMGL